VNPFTPKVRAVMRREFMQRVKSKWFLLSTLGLPVLMVGLMFLAGFLVATSSDDTGDVERIGIVDSSGRLGDLIVSELLGDSVFAARAREFEALPEAETRTRLVASDYDVLLLAPAELIDAGEDDEVRAQILAVDNVAGGTEESIRGALRRALVRARLGEAGIEGVDVEALLRAAPVRIVTVSGSGEARSQQVYQLISFVIAFLFYMVLLIYGQMIIRSIIEEKASDIVEIMVSSLRPWELMLGKIVGVGAVGLAQIGVWVLVLSGVTLLGTTSLGASLADAGVDLSAITIPWGLVALVLAFFVLGYLLFAGMFAGTGATISSESDAQQAALPVTMLIILPFIAVQGIVTSPNATWAVVFSLIPFFSPLSMTPRLLITSVPAWQIAVSLGLLALSVLGAAWVAGRIYRVGILMKGQRANLPQVIRWVRHG
jgi:ABC-2 type transport system permease protein